MRALIQRVSSASVDIDGVTAGRIGKGLVIFFCAMRDDSSEKIPALARKISKLRIFSDSAGKMNLSIADIGGSVLVVSQFTLAADTSRGNRPGFSGAAPPEPGERLYRQFVEEMRGYCVAESGTFGADMKVSLTNDGPVTIWLDL